MSSTAPIQTFSYGGPSYQVVGSGFSGGLAYTNYQSAGGSTAQLLWNFAARAVSSLRITPASGGTATSPNGAGGYVLASGSTASNALTQVNGATYLPNGNSSAPPPPATQFAGDLDVFGSTFSLGSLAQDANTAGLTLSFNEELNAQPGPVATVMFGAGRQIANWLWARADSSSASNAVPMMQLDARHRLGLFPPDNATLPASIVLDPAGRSRFDGPVRIKPQGDLPMGQFISEPAAP